MLCCFVSELNSGRLKGRFPWFAGCFSLVLVCLGIYEDDMPVGTLDYKGNSEKVSRSDMQFVLFN